MRTTVTLTDEACDIAHRYAESCDVSLSQAVSELIEQAARKKPRIKFVDGIAVFDEPESGPKITTEDVKRIEADAW